MEKPGSVVLAVNLLWASIGIGIVKSLIVGLPPSAHTAGPLFITTVLGITLGLTALLIFKISAGRNWARITFAVFFVLGLPTCIGLLLTNQFYKAPINGIALLVQTAMQGYAMYLVFTKPGNTWYRKVGAVQAEEESTGD